MTLRLDKFLSEQTTLSRSEIKKAASKGRIMTDGKIIKDCSLKINPELNIIFLDGKKIEYRDKSIL